MSLMHLHARFGIAFVTTEKLNPNKDLEAVIKPAAWRVFRAVLQWAASAASLTGMWTCCKGSHERNDENGKRDDGKNV